MQWRIVGALLTVSVLPARAAAPPSGTPKSDGHHVEIQQDADFSAAMKAAPLASDWPDNHYARLLDLGDITVSRDGGTTGVFRETYKLFDKNARDLAEVSLPYNSSYQSLRVLYARTYRRDGTVVSVKPADIRQTSPYSEYLMYDDARAVGFSMPAIEDNCIIDYKYEVITRPVLMPGQCST